MLFLECKAASQDLELSKNFKKHMAWGCHIACTLGKTWNKRMIFLQLPHTQLVVWISPIREAHI